MTSIHIRLALALMLALSIASCKSRQYNVSEPSLVTTIAHDTVYRTNIIHDSVYQFRDRLIRAVGDTIYVRDSIYLRKLVYLHDSIHVVKVDSIPYRVTVVQEVPRKRKWYDWLSYGTVLGIFAYCGLRIITKIYGV